MEKDLKPKQILEKAYSQAFEEELPELGPVYVNFERPRNPEHGDWATSFALQYAKRAKRSPYDLAVAVSTRAMSILRVQHGDGFTGEPRIEGPGFVNHSLKPFAIQQVVRQVLTEAVAFGRARAPRPEKIQVEFVSANPTGPLHLGHGRQAALGDAIAALLESQGHAVTREFYYNDEGAQIRNLALSVQARARGLAPGDRGWPADGYQGDYIQELADSFLAQRGDPQDLEAIRRFAVAALRAEQDADLQRFGVRFDVYTLESRLYAEGEVEAAVKALVASGRTFEKDGALWLRTTGYGDDKDRVVRKTDGSYTYFVPDVAYHVSKWRRGFTRVINVQGTDHHSTVTRVRAGLQALGIGIPQGYPDYVLHSLVKVMRGGAEVKISKRAGSYVTLRDLLEWAGRDATRFFLASRRADAEFVFDVDLAVSRSDENPVYYVQYAHARVCSVFAQWGGDPRRLLAAALAPLAGARELALAQRLAEYPETLAAAARELAPHAIAFYLRDLAADFHSYYNAERILVDDPALREARLALCAAIRQTLANGLALLGVAAPETM
jgi:arginyl-tRNA synthetase